MRIYDKLNGIRDFEKQMAGVCELMKRITPDAAEAIRSLAHQLGRTGLNIEQMKYPNKSL
ncbi:hypothetical protein M5X06_31080 [Paenibacillus alvei]|uniref:Uncharacterized protein n=1 Tax=Paenibacillus alvei TaxID=44250 RepID=A0ABT4H7S3_PAEAL|nr:hypothetical protein [Paenibacillus alvei]MCY9539157.1 hypothetical protein [Paenibacillus alvei]MCY9764939.1 hypothetical protein [Paenibacillus alvei]MCY9771220.1 hypothetical protein [Paenibacillus alvei]